MKGYIEYTNSYLDIRLIPSVLTRLWLSMSMQQTSTFVLRLLEFAYEFLLSRNLRLIIVFQASINSKRIYLLDVVKVEYE